MFDFSGAIVLVVFLSPFILAAAVGILLMDGRPVLFGHERIGEGGRRFRCLKFRTMRRDSEAALAHLLEASPAARAEWDATHKLRDDPRVIPGIGQILRTTSLDELPQFWNVLRGEMSLVGPRPIVEAEMVRYGDAIESYLSVRPGVTGPWQISGRSDTDYADRVALDTAYVARQSLMGDLRICLCTVAAVILRRGAY